MRVFQLEKIDRRQNKKFNAGRVRYTAAAVFLTAAIFVLPVTAEEGNQEEGQVLEISTPEELVAYMEMVSEQSLTEDGVAGRNSGVTTDISLTQDIDLTNGPVGSLYRGMGAEDNPYTGTINGNGHTVLLPAGGCGLINYAKDSTIKDLIVKSEGPLTFEGVQSAAGIVAHMEGGRIENCGNLAEVRLKGTGSAGGVAGTVNNTEIINCWNGASVRANEGRAGGVLGSGESANLKMCCNFGAVAGEIAGGVAGEISSAVQASAEDGGGESFLGMVENCYNGERIAGDQRAAGILASAKNTQINTCLNAGKIEAPAAYAVSPSDIQVQNCYFESNCGGDETAGTGVLTESLLSGSSKDTKYLDPNTWDYQAGYYPVPEKCPVKDVCGAAVFYYKEVLALSPASDGADWTINGESLEPGRLITLPSTLTFTSGDLRKEIGISGAGEVLAVEGYPSELLNNGKLLKIEPEVKAASGETVLKETEGYHIEYSTSPEISLTVTGTASGPVRWISLFPENCESKLQETEKGAVIKGRISGVVNETQTFRVCAVNSDGGIFEICDIPIYTVKGNPGFVLDEPGQQLQYDGEAVAFPVRAEEGQLNLEPEQNDVLYYRKNTDTDMEWVPTSPQNSGSVREGGEPVWSGTYKAVYSFAGNGYYHEAEIEKEFVIEARELEEAMAAETDWEKIEILNGPVAEKQIIVKETDERIATASGKTKLILGTDYTLIMEGHDRPGRAQVTITGTGNYKGTLNFSYPVGVGSYPVRLTAGQAFYLGTGRWILSEQPEIVYYGDRSFFVPSEGTYSFISAQTEGE